MIEDSQLLTEDSQLMIEDSQTNGAHSQVNDEDSQMFADIFSNRQANFSIYKKFIYKTWQNRLI